MRIVKMGWVLVMLSFSLHVWALTPVKLALDWYVNPDHAPILAAETQGYFQKEGLAVQLLEPAQNTLGRDLVVSGQADFALDYEPEALLAVGKGLPIRVVGILVPTPLSCIAVLEKSGILGLADLKGKTLGYSGSALDQSFLSVELQQAGLNPDAVTLMPVNMNLSQALLSEQVQGVSGMMRNVEPVILNYMGIKTRLFYPEQSGIPTYAALVVIANSHHLNPEVNAALMRAIARGAQYVKAHPDISFTLAETLYPTQLAGSKMQKAENQAVWNDSIPYFTTHPADYSQPQYQAFMLFLLKTKLLTHPVPFKDFFALPSTSG